MYSAHRGLRQRAPRSVDERRTDARPRNIVIDDTLGQASDGRFGWAIVASEGATVAVEGAALARNRHVGVSAESGASLELRDVAIEETLDSGWCEGVGGGIGAGVYRQAELHILRTTIRDSALVGLQIVSDGAVSAEDSAIVENLIGVNVQVPGFDIEAAFEGVVVERNRRDIAPDDLPIPAALGSFDAIDQ